jgi:hypothetical protein
MGGWGGYALLYIEDSFDVWVERSGPRGGPYTYGPRPELEPWVLSFGALSALIMLAAGIGLLFRRRWGPTLAGFAGTAWAILSFGILWSEVRFLRGFSISPDSARQWRVACAGGALVTLIFGLLCLSCLTRRPVREECGAGSPGRAVRISILVWAGAAVILMKLWYAWYWGFWSLSG